MNKNQLNNHSSTLNDNNVDLELMDTRSKEDPATIERQRLRDNEITKKLGEYLLKGYCMLNETCPVCNCILLRTRESELFCVCCNEIDKDNKEIITKKKRKHSKNKQQHNDNCQQLENKLKWAVDELIKSQNSTRINEMCTVIIKLTETIKVLKQHEMSV